MTTRLSAPALVVVLLGALTLSACASNTATRRAQAALSLEGSADPQAKVWVCHKGKKGKWIHVATAATAAHERHGDRVSRAGQTRGAACVR